MLFEGVKYFLPSCLPPQRLADLSHALDINGAVRTDSAIKATHVVTNSHRFEGWQLIQEAESVVVVTEKWVERSVMIGKVQSPSNYSTDPSMIFSGVVACAADLQPQDVEVLSAGIPALGGQWRSVLTKDVTHLFALSTDSDKYAYAIAHKAQFDLKIVLPHWFDDVVRLGMGNLDVSPYEWPDPLVLKTPTEADKGKSDPSKRSRRLDSEKKALFSTSVLGAHTDIPTTATKDIFNERRVLLSTTLELNCRREALESSIERANGIIVSLDSNGEDDSLNDEASRVDECDIFVTKYRSGKAYFKAVKAGKTIGTLVWLFHVLSTGVLSRPLDHLLHYPIPKKPIANFSSHEITITNYTGEAREYLKKLIATMGATFTPSMSNRNTVLIAAYLEGTKTTKASIWSIPIVSHIWLEDCFIKWQNLTVGLEKYLSFPSGTDFAMYLGDRKVGGDVTDLAEVVRAEQTDEEEQEQGAVAAPLTTQNSARDAREVADLVENGMMEIDDAMPFYAGEDAVMGDEQIETKTSLSQKTRHASVASDDAVTSSRITIVEDPANAPLNVTGSGAGIMQDGPDGDEPVEVQKIVKVRGKGKEVERIGRNPRIEKTARGKARSSPIATDEEFEMMQPSAAAAINPKNISNALDDINHSSPVRPTSTPKRIVSVVMPPLLRGADSSPLASVRPSSSAKEGLKKMESVHIAAPERRRENTQSAVSTPKIYGSLSTAPGGSSPISINHSTRRVAAARASQRLHDEIMPDVLNFQQELRTQKSKKHRSASIVVDHNAARNRHGSVVQKLDDEGDDVRSRKGKAGNDLKGTSTVAKKDGAKDGVAEKKRKSGTLKTQSPNGDTDEDDEPPNQKKRKTAGSKLIKLMTTQVTLSDEVVKVLLDLGVKITTKASECTHLVVPSLVRTEKFLCALAVAPYILSESWATESAAAKELLPEERYLLNDKAGEKKYDFSLAEALSRAGQYKGRLLAKKTFYVTSGVSMSRALLKNVVSACGGQVVTQNPSLRILRANPDRHIISCPEDEAIWQPLAREYPIYNAELLLTGILKQEIEWDNEKFKVPGSC